MTVHDGIGSFPIGKRRLGVDAPVFVIAEIGVNHEGDAALCAWMIEAAARSGADAVKLQIIDAAENYAPGTESHALFSRAWLKPDEVANLFALSDRLGIEIFATCGDSATLDWVDRLKPCAHKISSGLLTHHPIIKQAVATGRPVLMSTGMAQDADIAEAMAVARASGGRALGLFQCTSLYPCPPERLNLRVISRLAAEYGIPVGFSDHSVGIEACALSVAAGATMIEKHFTFDMRRPGFDHRLSLEAADFARMVQAVRFAEATMGQAAKVLGADEQEAARRNHRRITARRPIAAGQTITADDIGFFRQPPAVTAGLPPAKADAVIGRRTRRSIAQYEPIDSADLE